VRQKELNDELTRMRRRMGYIEQVLGDALVLAAKNDVQLMVKRHEENVSEPLFIIDVNGHQRCTDSLFEAVAIYSSEVERAHTPPF
jgi:hypothetical protein